MLTYGFYNSVAGDRKYNAEQISQIFNGIITDGVFMSIGNALLVSATTGMNLVVGAGRAWFDGTWTFNDSNLALSVSAAEAILKRIDSVVLEVNSTSNVRSNSIKIVKGTPATNPVAPTLTNTTLIHQHKLADILVNPGVTTITQANITNKIGTSECPFVTGILETVDTDDLLVQWQAQFNAWFASIQNILDSNAAGNLLNLINETVLSHQSIIIPSNGWVGNTGDYAYKLDLPIAGVLATDSVDIHILPDYLDVASECDLASYTAEYAGGVTLYARQPPSAAMTAKYTRLR